MNREEVCREFERVCRERRLGDCGKLLDTCFNDPDAPLLYRLCVAQPDYDDCLADLADFYLH